MINKPKKALKGLFARTEPEEALDSRQHIEPQTEEIEKIEKIEMSVKAEPAEHVASRHEAMDVTPVVSALAEVAIPSPTPAVARTPDKELSRTFLSVRYNFELGREERALWDAEKYREFIRRIDEAQTEAFFLKGKLLAEAKTRFFVDNKRGWKDFAEKSLGMNYTTANQYIRVSQEFDVTAHQRADFGFEHYKTLLPLEPDERRRLISDLPAVSVKALRTIVHEKLTESGVGPVRSAERKSRAKEFVSLLLEVKKAIGNLGGAKLSQTELWQVTAACSSVAGDLSALADRMGGPNVGVRSGANAVHARAVSTETVQEESSLAALS